MHRAGLRQVNKGAGRWLGEVGLAQRRTRKRKRRPRAQFRTCIIGSINAITRAT